MKSGIHILELKKVLDYTFQRLSKKEERRVEAFLDENELYHDIVEELLDYCLEHQLTRVGLEQLLPINSELKHLVKRLEVLNRQNALAYIPQPPTFYEKNISPILSVFSFLIIRKRTAQALFTLLLMLNVPFLTSINENGTSWNTSVLKASSKRVLKKANIVTDYELKHIHVDMLEQSTITPHLDQVVLPITLELRYITND